MKKFKIIIDCTIIAVLVISMAYGAWTLNKYFNYKFNYQNQVEKTVRDMVKPEALK